MCYFNNNHHLFSNPHLATSVYKVLSITIDSWRNKNSYYIVYINSNTYTIVIVHVFEYLELELEW